MGNKRNKSNSHLNRGKFHKRKLPNKQLKKDKENAQPNHENVSYSPLEGSRIINLTTTSTDTHTHTDSAHTGSPNSDETTIMTVADQERQAWEDALDEHDLDAVRSVPAEPSVEVDPEMLCGIQCVVGRLIGKAEQLLGMIHRSRMQKLMHKDVLYMQNGTRHLIQG